MPGSWLRELKNIKVNAEAAAGMGSNVTNVVFTVPAYCIAEEKRALIPSKEERGTSIAATPVALRTQSSAAAVERKAEIDSAEAAVEATCRTLAEIRIPSKVNHLALFIPC